VLNFFGFFCNCNSGSLYVICRAPSCRDKKVTPFKPLDYSHSKILLQKPQILPNFIKSNPTLANSPKHIEFFSQQQKKFNNANNFCALATLRCLLAKRCLLLAIFVAFSRRLAIKTKFNLGEIRGL
jgi:hypothetical protein